MLSKSSFLLLIVFFVLLRLFFVFSTRVDDKAGEVNWETLGICGLSAGSRLILVGVAVGVVNVGGTSIVVVVNESQCFLAIISRINELIEFLFDRFFSFFCSTFGEMKAVTFCNGTGGFSLSLLLEFDICFDDDSLDSRLMFVTVLVATTRRRSSLLSLSEAELSLSLVVDRSTLMRFVIFLISNSTLVAAGGGGGTDRSRFIFF